jgi:hypothetical protein
VATTVPKEGLRSIFATLSGLPEAFVRWDGEPVAPVDYDHDGRRIILNVLSRRRVGRDQAERTYPDETTLTTKYTGQRVLTISVRAENYGSEEGFDLLEDVRTQLEQHDTGEDLNALGLALNETFDVRNLPGQAGNRKISVAQFDFSANQAVTRTVTVTSSGEYIETVEMAGEGDLSRTGTFETPAWPDD